MEKRSRYYCAVVDIHALKKGETYQDLPERYVIFILDNDYLKGGHQVYHINQRADETQQLFEDGGHVIFINASKSHDKKISNPELEDLLADFRCSDPNKIKNELFAKRVRELKETKEERVVMNKVIQKEFDKYTTKVKEESKAEGLAKGVIKGKAEAIMQFMDVLGISLEEAMDKIHVSQADRLEYAKIIKGLKSKKSKDLVH